MVPPDLSSGNRARAAGDAAATLNDINAVVGAHLRDMALAQSSSQKMFGYRRAAAAVLALDRPVTALLQRDGTFEKVPGIGPASTRIIQEVLETGTSSTVELAVAGSSRAADIRRRRALRDRFLSRAAVLSVLQDPSLGGPAPAGCRGDLQMHSEWSDGNAALTEIADACSARGYQYAAVTDHSYGLKIAGGMSMEDAAGQHQAIVAINDAVRDFRLMRGIEANIGSAGDLDLTPGEVQRFELVLAAPHSRLRTGEDQTERLLRALETPHVHILAHPRGRMMETRAGLVADWDAVFAAAAAKNVAIEIDGDPFRQDVDYILAARARDAGCLFAVDSDAHTVGQLRYIETAIAHARLAAIPEDRILNYWDLDRLLRWLDER